MFGVQYLNYHQIPTSYQEGGASDSHSLTLSEIWNHALTLVQYLNTAQLIQFILQKTKEAVNFD